MSELLSPIGRTIMFYNIENMYDTKADPNTNDRDFTPEGAMHWTDKKYKTKLGHIARVIRSIHRQMPILIGLAEIENKEVIKDLLRRFKLHDIYEFAHVDSDDRRGIDVALIYDKRYFKMINFEQIKVYINKTQSTRTRGILHVSGKMHGIDNLHIFINHWPSRCEGKTRSQANRIDASRTLKREVQNTYKQNINTDILIMGDFNDTPADISLTRILGTKNRTTNKSTDLINLAHPLHIRKNGTVEYEKRYYMFDQMIVSQSLLNHDRQLRLSSQGLQILKHRWMMVKDRKTHKLFPNRTYGGNHYYGGYSDHLPIYIKFLDAYKKLDE
ncbi:MAG: hypothetical protein ACK5L5_10715 [Bacteroidales bacterium]